MHLVLNVSIFWRERTLCRARYRGFHAQWRVLRFDYVQTKSKSYSTVDPLTTIRSKTFYILVRKVDPLTTIHLKTFCSISHSQLLMFFLQLNLIYSMDEINPWSRSIFGFDPWSIFDLNQSLILVNLQFWSLILGLGQSLISVNFFWSFPCSIRMVNIVV